MRAVTVLEPIASTSHDAHTRRPPVNEVSWPSWLQPLAASVAIILLVALTQLTHAGSSAESAPLGFISATMAGPHLVAPTPTPPAQAGPSDATSSPYPSSAVLAVEAFMMMVNSGDSDAVLELLLDDVTRPGTGTAQYPHLPTDAGLWSDGVLDKSRVEGFVGYVAALPGPVNVTGCASVAGGVTTTLVGCTYTTSGGVLAALGQGPETGQLYVVTIEDKVAGLIHAGDADVDLWDRFAKWVAHTHPNLPLSRLDHVESGSIIDPEYSRQIALEQTRLASDMAAAPARRQLETRVSRPQIMK